jgi:hypothetical protein
MHHHLIYFLYYLCFRSHSVDEKIYECVRHRPRHLQYDFTVYRDARKKEYDQHMNAVVSVTSPSTICLVTPNSRSTVYHCGVNDNEHAETKLYYNKLKLQQHFLIRRE